MFDTTIGVILSYFFLTGVNTLFINNNLEVLAGATDAEFR
jgi:hypothetical protein